MKSKVEVATKKLIPVPPEVSQFDSMPDDSMLRPKPAAMIAAISISTLWRYVKLGHIKTKKLSDRVTVIRAGDLRAFINGNVEAK
jgi:hypothetical protein